MNDIAPDRLPDRVEGGYGIIILDSVLKPGIIEVNDIT
jgi:hypothetical protein